MNSHGFLTGICGRKGIPTRKEKSSAASTLWWGRLPIQVVLALNAVISTGPLVRCFADREVGCRRMMKRDGRDGTLRIHHEAFGQVDADLARIEEIPENGLIVQSRAGRV